ncbi:MAG TPA: hypothetical protein VEU96_25900 [Bryobacteraceae bacterium]|nr:hypothetical protein [Bryobacteraceae bacterium]
MRDLFQVLLKHFFDRFFDNELVSRQGDMTASLSKIAGVLAAPGLLCFWMMPKYVVLALQPAARAEAGSLPDKLFFLTFSMAAMGFLTVLEWDALFPDRRDFTILIPLPIRLESVFVAKIVSLCGFVLLFTVAANAISTFVYPFVAMRPPVTPATIFGQMASHAVAVLAGTCFMFFFFVALQGLLMNFLSFRAFRRASTYVQLLSVFALLFMTLLLLDSSSLLHSPKYQHFLYYFPPVWFLGLYETLMHQPDPLPGSSALAIRALWMVIGASLLAYVLSYKRHVKRSLESEDIFDVVPSRITNWLCVFADRFVVPRPLEQASFYFTAKTMFRSRKHWLYLSAYVGVGFALILQGLMAAMSRHGNQSAGLPAPTLLSIPLILSFFVLSGMRFVFTLPAELKANWVFQLSEADGRKECLSGVRKAMFVVGVLPLFAALLPFYIFLWGWATAGFHTFFDIVLSLLLIEVLLLKFHKIPFTCSYLPGKANITAYWFLYWLAFATYAYTMASVEIWALREPIRMAGLYLLGGIAVAGAYFYRNRLLAEGFTLVFEEEPEPVVRTLNLSAPGSW